MTEDVVAKLDVLIKLQAAALIAQMKSSKDKIAFLHNAGLRPTLIAEIVGTTTNHVNVTISNLRKVPKRKLEK
jgi:CHAD domain-containing protein